MGRFLRHPVAFYVGIAMVAVGSVLVISSADFRAWDYKRRFHAEACGRLKTDADVQAEVAAINALTTQHIGHHIVSGGDFWCVERAPWTDDGGEFEWLAEPTTDEMKDEIDRAIPRGP